MTDAYAKAVAEACELVERAIGILADVGEMGIFTHTNGTNEIHVIGHMGRKLRQAMLLRDAADQLDVPKGYTLQ